MKTDNSAATSDHILLSPAQALGNDSGKSLISRFVTTSWDDGDPADLRVGGLLAARNISGTFYIPIRGHHRSSRMALSEMLELDARRFEIGAHSVTHPILTECDERRLVVEVEGCKKRLEDDLGKSVTMFAYPRGRHNRKVIAALKQAGYEGGRTTAMLARGLKFDPFRMPTSVQAFPHSRVGYLRNLVRAWDVRRAWAYAAHLRCAPNWIDLAKILFDSVLKCGGVWHLYGHSWEIEELRLWSGLQEVLDYVSNRPGVLYLANGPLVKLRRDQCVEAEDCTVPRSDPLVEATSVPRAGTESVWRK
jgi:peptidoglycan/xylan/chitin deacetylase (PgdA/CDA1 family)